MSEIKDQIKLLKDVKAIRNSYQDLKLESWHYKYLLDFFKKHRLFCLALVVLLLSQGLLESLLIIFSRDQLSDNQQLYLAPFFWQVLLGLLIIFFINSYLSIKQEKTLGVLLVNDIRKRLYRSYIKQPLNKFNQNSQSDLIAKVSYHLPLVSMGISNSLFGILRWLIYVLVALLIAYLGGFNWLLILGVIVVLSLAISVAAYFVAKRYISAEVTFYSKIIKQISVDTSEKYFNKNFSQEKNVLNKFDELVKFDSFFRIRRDLWIKLGSKVVFAILLVLSVLTHFFSREFFAWINSIGPETKFLYLFIMIYFSRALYESLRIGLYTYPARLGVYLTVLKNNSSLVKERPLRFSKDLLIYSRKTKLFKEGDYYRRFNLNFKKGESYLFYGPSRSGKTSLFKLISGLEAYNSKAIKLKLDGQRYDYRHLQASSGIVVFSPDFYSEKSIMEFILGQDRSATDFSKIEEAIEVLMLNPQLKDLGLPAGNFNASVAPLLQNKLSAFALYVLQAIVLKPALIVIDNLWLDLGYKEIELALVRLKEVLPETTVVVFSRTDNDYLIYDKKYEMGKKFKDNF